MKFQHDKLRLPPGCQGRCFFLKQTGVVRRPHTHAELEINIVTAGRGSYLIGDKRYDLRRHDILWLFPNQGHVLVEEAPDFRMWIAVFRPQLIYETARAEDYTLLRKKDPGNVFCRRLTGRTANELTDFCEKVRAAEQDPSRANAGLCYLLLQAWHATKQAQDTFPTQAIHPAVEQAVGLLRNQAETLDATLEALAKQCGLSPARLSRLFKEQVGMPLNEFRNRRRLEYFLDIYEPESRTMLDTALRAGFGSYPQFHRVFKKFMGKGPAEYFGEE